MRTSMILLALSLGLAGCLGDGGGDPPAGIHQPSQACLDQSNDEYRVRVDGVELANHEGAAVHVVTDLQLAFAEPHCVISAPARVEGGGFVVELTNYTDGAAYPLVAAFVDVDDDGLCTPGVDLEWRIVGSVAPGGEMALTLGPEDFTVAGELEVCGYFD